MDAFGDDSRATASATGGNAPRVVEVDPSSDPRWARFVESHPDGLVYHHSAWLETIARTYGYEFLGLASEDESGVLSGVLPLFEKRGLVTGDRLSSLPHTPVAGPLAAHDAAALALGQAAVERARARGLGLELKLPSAELGRLLAPSGLVAGDAAYVLELPEHEEELRFGSARNRSRIKWAVGKAAREGVRVREAEDQLDVREWYALYLRTMRWHSIPPRPYAFFKAIWELLGARGQVRLLLAERTSPAGRTLIAGSMLLTAARTVFYAFNGCRREDLHLRPNDVIQWQAIHDACRAGFRRYDMGEVTAGQGGLADFKAKWGASEQRLYRYRYPAPGQAHPQTRAALAHRVGAAAWRRLPLRVTVRIGDWLYRHA